jgi:poly-gamma-glutamate capsule biosynthesis protein CapA/YwtB (metallophosphatase superfamily)
MNGARPAALAFIGDVMLGRLVNEQIPLRPPGAFWGTALPMLLSADAVFANLECAITEHDRPWRPAEKVFHFRAAPEAVAVLKAGGVSCVSLANNHVLDFEVEGLLDTLRFLDGAGIGRAGAGRNLREAMAPCLVEAGGLRVSFTALTNNEPEWAAGEDRPGVFFMNVEDQGCWDETLRAAWKATASLAPDMRVLSAHIGPNMRAEPSLLFRRFAETALRHGFDVFFGHSAHVFQGVRVLNGKLILHDAGDFLDDYAVDPALRNDWSFIFFVDAAGGALLRLRMEPVELGFAEVNRATGEAARAIVRLMRKRCRRTGTAPVDWGEGLALEIGGRGKP